MSVHSQSTSRPQTLMANAAQRALRREMVRLNDARLELIEALDDPRLPLGVAAQQVSQCDHEIREMIDACRILDAHAEAQSIAAE